MSGPTDARPRQVRLADDIREKIEAGEYTGGQRLPTLDDLADTYQCSLAVARRAIDLLKGQGLVVTEQGRGTYVRKRPQTHPHGIEHYSRSRWRAASTTIPLAETTKQDQKIRELAEVPAPKSVAEQFEIAPGTTVWVRRHTTYVDNRPYQLADRYYELDVVEGTRIRHEDTGPGGEFARLEDAGYTLAEISQDWQIRMPTGPEAVALLLPPGPGTPVADLTQTTYTATGKPVEVMHAVIAGDMVRISYRLPIPD